MLFFESFRKILRESDDATVYDKFNLRGKDQRSKDRTKRYADHRRRARVGDLSVGDRILCRQSTKSKKKAPFHTNPFTVVAVKGSMITAERSGNRIARNAFFIKIVNQPMLASTGNPSWKNAAGDLEAAATEIVRFCSQLGICMGIIL